MHSPWLLPKSSQTFLPTTSSTCGRLHNGYINSTHILVVVNCTGWQGKIAFSRLLSFREIVRLPWEECTYDRKETCFVSFHTVQNVVLHATVWKSPRFICFSRFLFCKTFGYLLWFVPIVPTTLIDDSFSSCNRGMLVKKLSMYTTVSLSRSCITRSVTTVCTKPLSEFLPLFPVYTWKSYRYPQHEQANSQILVPLLIGFIGRYCLKGFFPFPFTICSSTQMCWPIL